MRPVTVRGMRGVLSTKRESFKRMKAQGFGTRENITVNPGIHSTNFKNALKHVCKVADRCTDTAKTKVHIIFPAILVLVNIPVGRSSVVAVLCNIRTFEYPHAPHTIERVRCEIRSNATLPRVAHLGIDHYPPSRTLPPSKKWFSHQDPCRAIVAGIGGFFTLIPEARRSSIDAKRWYISSIHTTELSVMSRFIRTLYHHT